MRALSSSLRSRLSTCWCSSRAGTEQLPCVHVSQHAGAPPERALSSFPAFTSLNSWCSPQRDGRETHLRTQHDDHMTCARVHHGVALQETKLPLERRHPLRPMNRGLSVHCVLEYLLLDYMGWWAPVCCGMSVHCQLCCSADGAWPTIMHRLACMHSLAVSD